MSKSSRFCCRKILPDAFATDPDRLARFTREAQILASLNHPNIAAIYGIEEAEGTRALVLELVEGPTLADRISKGPIPLDEALPIAKQIAEALEAAHEAGVIHRDLKPANIKVREDGTVKVLDFGLAKALAPDADGDPSQSPTLTEAATRMGVIMGTAAYMAPEQAKGRVADKRADVWAFGVVLYEMLTGRQPFTGQTVSDTLASVLAREPDWQVLPTDTPLRLEELLHRCLEKDVSERLRDVGEARIGIARAATAPATEPAPAPLRPTVWRRALPWVAGIAVGSLVTGLVAWSTTRTVPPRPVRLDVQVPLADTLTGTSLFFSSPPALSPDGRTLVYAASRDERQQLFLRPLDRFEASPLARTEDASNPFFSPDGQWVAFRAVEI